MEAIIRTHLAANHVQSRDFFRAAYMAKFGHDAPAAAITDDVYKFDKTGTVPGYVADYVVGMYSSH